MSRFLAIVAMLLAILAPPCVAGDEHEHELVFGVYPYMSPTQIASQFAPLNTHVATVLGRPVGLRSAPDFRQFIERTARGEYDIVFTAPHMGRLAQLRDGYVPLVQSGWQIEVMVLARRDRPIERLADLDGQALAIGDRLSMSYQIADHALREHGLALGRQVRFVDTAGFSNIIDALMRGEADAGITAPFVWERATPEVRAALRPVHHFAPVPGFLLLAHARLGPEIIERLSQALIGFHGTPAGRNYFAVTGQIDLRPIGASTLRDIDPYIAALRDGN